MSFLIELRFNPVAERESVFAVGNVSTRLLLRSLEPLE